jgi:hypothetical protein
MDDITPSIGSAPLEGVSRTVLPGAITCTAWTDDAAMGAANNALRRVRV